MTADEAIRDLLSISTDIRRVAVFEPSGALLASAPDDLAADVNEAAERLWQAAARRAADLGAAPLEHVAVHHEAGVVAVLQRQGRRIVALAAPDAAVGLLLFDLRTCLSDSFVTEATA